jgi:hypothetical protein
MEAVGLVWFETDQAFLGGTDSLGEYSGNAAVETIVELDVVPEACAIAGSFCRDYELPGDRACGSGVCVSDTVGHCHHPFLGVWPVFRLV